MGQSNFIDYVKIFCRSGKGGSGSMHFHRSRKVPRGGPDGGDGGQGGHIIMRGDSQKWTLLHLRYTKHLRAEHGLSGGDNRKSGAAGKDLYINVPLGSIAKDAETEKILGEIKEEGEEIILMKGGRGGLGNDHFKSSTNRTPHYAQPGEDSQEAWIILELKLLADVGLVGFPNAGKSTLLSVISAAKPEIADYPFTTLVPNLGVVSYFDDRSFVMADIPGIIEGAHEGKGLGLRFLRHIERNSILLFLIPADSENHLKEYKTLVNELKQYNPELLLKEKVISISKSDLLNEKEMKKIEKKFSKNKIIFFSSISGYKLPELKKEIWEKLN